MPICQISLLILLDIKGEIIGVLSLIFLVFVISLIKTGYALGGFCLITISCLLCKIKKKIQPSHGFIEFIMLIATLLFPIGLVIVVVDVYNHGKEAYEEAEKSTYAFSDQAIPTKIKTAAKQIQDILENKQQDKYKELVQGRLQKDKKLLVSIECKDSSTVEKVYATKIKKIIDSIETKETLSRAKEDVDSLLIAVTKEQSIVDKASLLKVQKILFSIKARIENTDTQTGNFKDNTIESLLNEKSSQETGLCNIIN